MTKADQILLDIKNGSPFTYPATLKPGRFYTIEIKENSGVTRFVLSANNLKSREVLTEAGALNIITNTLEKY